MFKAREAAWYHPHAILCVYTYLRWARGSHTYGTETTHNKKGETFFKIDPRTLSNSLLTVQHFTKFALRFVLVYETFNNLV